MILTSRATDYGLLLLVELAKLSADEMSNVKKVSEKLNISLRFLANIANKLSTAGVIISHRGVNGGIRLARSSEKISIKEVLEAIDGPMKTMLCQSISEDCFHEPSCSMKFFWDDLQNTITKKLTDTTIKDLLEKKLNREIPQKPIEIGLV
jgi:Rrf2 family protein